MTNDNYLITRGDDDMRPSTAPTFDDALALARTLPYARILRPTDRLHLVSLTNNNITWVNPTIDFDALAHSERG